MKNQKGFTLIELMVTATIVGTLCSIAVPLYDQYTARSQATEGLVLVGPSKNAIAQSAVELGSFCGANEECGVPANVVGRYISSIAISNAGVITSTFGPDSHGQLNGKKLIHTPTNIGGTVTWTCKGTMAKQYLPRGCGGFTDNDSGPSPAPQTFATYQPPEEVCTDDDVPLYENPDYMRYGWKGGIWVLVGEDGNSINLFGIGQGRHKFFNCSHVREYKKSIANGTHGIKGHVNMGGKHFCIVEEYCDTPELGERADPALYNLDRTYPHARYIYAHPNTREFYSTNPDARKKYGKNTDHNYFIHYDFATGIWSNAEGEKFKSGQKVS